MKITSVFVLASALGAYAAPRIVNTRDVTADQLGIESRDGGKSVPGVALRDGRVALPAARPGGRARRSSTSKASRSQLDFEHNDVIEARDPQRDRQPPGGAPPAGGRGGGAAGRPFRRSEDDNISADDSAGSEIIEGDIFELTEANLAARNAQLADDLSDNDSVLSNDDTNSVLSNDDNDSLFSVDSQPGNPAAAQPTSPQTRPPPPPPALPTPLPLAPPPPQAAPIAGAGARPLPPPPGRPFKA
ncbi:hypothetical protein QBC40DRAFT_349421 [Triangularia verruculosa]|uniref:Uncharacterized protein n=1 Tax=Triangularia verruculosa TaxID=2587418 RepID=A0AAN7AUX8_9PEZI|nr:hypothetical protein QBC40DRAFT_349421 [Triangularia verruculosa]